jgi:hypothetical protein
MTLKQTKKDNVVFFPGAYRQKSASLIVRIGKFIKTKFNQFRMHCSVTNKTAHDVEELINKEKICKIYKTVSQSNFSNQKIAFTLNITREYSINDIFNILNFTDEKILLSKPTYTYSLYINLKKYVSDNYSALNNSELSFLCDLFKDD